MGLFRDLRRSSNLTYNRECRLVRYDPGERGTLYIWGDTDTSKALPHVMPKPRKSPREYRSPYIGPVRLPVHLVILKGRLVKQRKWIAQQTVSFTLVSLSANKFPDDPTVYHYLPGTATTMGLYIIVLTTDGPLLAGFMHMLRTLSEGLEVFGFAQGVSQIEPVPSDPIYALLTCVKALTLGSITLAGLQLSTQTTTDGTTRAILMIATCTGPLYTTLWFSRS